MTDSERFHFYPDTTEAAIVEIVNYCHQISQIGEPAIFNTFGVSNRVVALLVKTNENKTLALAQIPNSEDYIDLLISGSLDNLSLGNFFWIEADPLQNLLKIQEWQEGFPFQELTIPDFVQILKQRFY